MVTPGTHALRRTALRRTALLAALALLLVAGSGNIAAEQDLEATFENNVIDGSEAPVNETLTVTGHTGEVTVRSENLSEEILAEMFDGREAGDGVRIDVPDDGNLTVTFPPHFRCSRGEYTFTVSDGERRANASINVSLPLILPAEFDRSSLTVPAGETALIPVKMGECQEGNMTIRIGGQNSSVHAEVTVAPNGSVVTEGNVSIDTGNLTGPDSFEAGSGFVRKGLTVHVIPPNGSLPAGVYDLALSADGEAYDLAPLHVEDDSSAAPADGTATADPGDGTESRADGATTDAKRSPQDMPGFGFAGGLLAVLACLALVYRDD